MNAKKAVIAIGCLILAIAILTELRFLVIQVIRNREWRSPGKSDVDNIAIALKQYHEEFGVMSGDDHRTVMRALIGDNPRKTVFINPPLLKSIGASKQGFANGVWYDPWGSPYRIDVSDPKNPKVWSPGKNKKDESDDPRSDDICSWR